MAGSCAVRSTASSTPSCGRRCARSTRTSRPPATARCAPRCSASTASTRSPATCACPTRSSTAPATKLAPELRDALDSMIARAPRLQRARAARQPTGARRSRPASSSASARARSRPRRSTCPAARARSPRSWRTSACRQPSRACPRSSCSARRCARPGASIRPTSTSPPNSGCARSGASTARAASPRPCSGTASIPRVRKVVGPGSPAVTVAQLLAAEHGVATNMLQGPSESLILADDSADAELLAVDLLTEAEHGADSAATLVTWSEALATAVADAVEPRLAALPHAQRDHASAALDRPRRHPPVPRRGRGLRVRERVRGRAPADRHRRPRGHAGAHRLRRRDPDRAAHADGGRQLHDRRAQHAALGRLRGRLERRDRAHLPGHQLDRRAECRGARGGRAGGAA